MSSGCSLIGGIRWRHRTRSVSWRLGRGILVRYTYYTYMTCWSKAGRPLREWRSSSSLYLAVVTICWIQNPIVKGENFLFLPLLLVECFLTVLGETNSQEISINRPRKWNLLIMHISVEMSSLSSCKSLIYWSFKPQKLNLCNNSSLTKTKNRELLISSRETSIASSHRLGRIQKSIGID